MNTDVPAYGLWSLVVINALVFIIFSASPVRAQPVTGAPLPRSRPSKRYKYVM